MTKIKLDKTFTIADIEFINLGIDKETGGIIGVTKNRVFASRFGDNNNFAESNILTRLNAEVLPKIEEVVGPDGLLEFNLDLKSKYHPNLYADLRTKIGLPTLNMYLEHTEDLRQGNFDYYWLSTAGSEYLAFYVSPYGGYCDCHVSGNTLDVRPICIFNPNLFEAYHACQYCGQITKGFDEDILCEDCREMFGHTLFSQL
jgi:hypothetical protein